MKQLSKLSMMWVNRFFCLWGPFPLHNRFIIFVYACFAGLCTCKLRQNLESYNEQNIWVWEVSGLFKISVLKQVFWVVADVTSIMIWFTEYMVQMMIKRLCLMKWSLFWPLCLMGEYSVQSIHSLFRMNKVNKFVSQA